MTNGHARRSVAQLLCAAALLLAPTAGFAGSASLALVHDFAVTPVPYWPTAILRAPDGNFYGTLQFGGPPGYGALFRMTPEGVATSLHYFDLETDGGRPQSLIIGRDGALYGTSSPCSNSAHYWCYGSVSIFRATLDGEVRVLHRFEATSTRSYANPLIEASDGQLYGTTDADVFRIDAGGNFEVVHHFADYRSLSPVMQASNGLLYVTSFAPYATGRFYGVAPDGALSVDVSLGLGSALMEAPLTQGADGLLYGTAACYSCYYDADGAGYLFRVSLDGVVSLLRRFGSGGDEYALSGPLVAAADGTLYGLASYGPNAGSIFRLTSAGTTTIVSGLRRPSDLWATEAGLGRYGRRSSTRNPSRLVTFDGTTFMALMANRLVEARLDGSVDTIHLFTGGSELRSPQTLMHGHDGLLHGLAFSGAVGPPAVFTMTPEGAVTAVHELDVQFCDCQYTVLTQADDGAVWVSDGLDSIIRVGPDGLYRSFSLPNDVYALAPDSGGAVLYASYNSLTRLASDGTATPLHQLTVNEGSYIATLVRADDGRVFGIAEGGGTYSAGTLFAIDAAGRFSVLHRFGEGSAGWRPSRLALGPQGQLYGLTNYGASFSDFRGTVFRFEPHTGVMTSLGPAASSYYWNIVAFAAGPAGAYLADTAAALVRVGNAGDRSTLGSWSGLQSTTSFNWTGDGTFYAATATGGSGQGAIYRLTVPSATDNAPTMMVRNPTTGSLLAWRLSDATVAGDLVLPEVTDRAWQLVTTADLTGDGRADAIWHHLTTGATVVWSLGGGIIEQISLPTVPDRAWHLVASADVNRDGSFDLLWRNYRTGANAVWYMHGTSLVGGASLPAEYELAWELVAAADLNQDGAPDLVWRHAHTGANVIWYLSGTTVIGQAPLPGVTDHAWRLRQAIDIDGDGRPELVWQHRFAGAIVAWRVQGSTIVGSVPIAVVDPAWIVAGADVPPVPADVNGDRHPDLLWHHASGANAIWTMLGALRLTQVFLPAVLDSNWQLVGRADFNGDTYPDLVWRNRGNGQNKVWLMNGTTTQNVDLDLTSVADPSWQIGAFADVDLDSRPEVIWRNAVTGANVIWFMNGAAVTRQVSLPTVSDPAWRIAASADLNGDGFPDLIWRNSSTGDDKVWYLQGASLASTADLPTVIDPAWRIAMAADIDGDEWPDLVWRNTNTGENRVWYLSGTTLRDQGTLPAVPDTSWELLP